MAVLKHERIAELLKPYLSLSEAPSDLISKLATYLELLVRWNARTNLTAVRDPEQLVQRQVGESLFAAGSLHGASLLDFGSGAGFPGIPLQLLRPKTRVTLAESQGKKAGFLREAVRVLEIPTEVWASRVELMPASSVFDVVTMRAVDQTGSMSPIAAARVAGGGRLLRFAGEGDLAQLDGWRVTADTKVPRSSGRLAVLEREHA